MTQLIQILLILSFASVITACKRSSTTPVQQTVTGGWRIIDQGESQSGEKEFQVYTTAKNPPDEVTLRFKLPGWVERGFSTGDGFTVIFKDVDASYHFDCRELLARKNHFRQDQLLDLEQFRMKKGQQDGTGQPATRPESKSDGGHKPQPESEGRSR